MSGRGMAAGGLAGDGHLGRQDVDVKACCAAAYEHEAAQWLLGDERRPGGKRLTRRLAELVALGRGERVLDVASGRGATALLVATERDVRVTGVDLSAAQVEAACARARANGFGDSVDFVQADAERLPFADSSFDVVFCECSLCTFPDKHLAAREIARVLRPGGRLALADVTAEAAQLDRRLRTAAARVACIADALSEEEYVRVVERAGFQVSAVEHQAGALERLVRQVDARLRLCRMLQPPQLAPFHQEIDDATELASLALDSIAAGNLGYMTLAARKVE